MISLSVQAISGQAIDRHLLGLKLLALEENLTMPEIFTDPAFAKALHYRLSTSQVKARVERAESTHAWLIPNQSPRVTVLLLSL